MKLKVAIITSMGKPPYLGGIENVVDTLINSALKNTYTFKIFDTFRTADPKRKTFEKAQFAFKLAFLCGSFLLSYKPALVHIHFCSNNDFFKHAICLLMSRIFGTKTIFHLHGGSFDKFYFDSSPLTRMIVHFVFRTPHRVIALSEYWAKFLSDFVPAERVRVVNNPIDCNKFSCLSNLKKDETKCKILLLGSVGKRKGHFDALKALPIVLKKYPNVILLFAGPDEFFGATDELKFIVDQYRLFEKVFFLGPITGKYKIDMLHSCSMMILPSHGENMPISVMEGMAAKLPVITSDVGALPELLENGRLGMLIKAGDYEALARNIIQLIESPQLAATLSEKAYNKVAAQYDIKKISADIDELYKEIMYTT